MAAFNLFEISSSNAAFSRSWVSTSSWRVVRNSEKLGLEILHLVDRNIIEEVVLHSPEGCGLEFNRDRVVILLVEDFDDARAAAELGLGLGVEIGAELGGRRRVRDTAQGHP